MMEKIFSQTLQPLFFKIALFILLILTGAFALHLYQYDQQGKKLKEVENSLIKINQENKELKNINDELKRNSELQDETRKQIDNEVDHKEKNVLVINSNASAREAAIKKKYAELQQQAQNQEDNEKFIEQRNNELSLSRIHEAWAVYCEADSTHPQCGELKEKTS